MADFCLLAYRTEWSSCLGNTEILLTLKCMAKGVLLNDGMMELRRPLADAASPRFDVNRARKDLCN